MTRVGLGALGALILLAGAATLALTAYKSTLSTGEKTPLALLTSLPIMLGEDFSLKSTGSPALTALSAKFQVAPISTTSAKELREPLLLMAQPPAQTPENLVALDNWVRRGGRVLLLADPMLEWPSKRPLGDLLRPPPMFADTGLLAHWGLRLDAPNRRGAAVRTLAGYHVLTISPGALYGSCTISADRLVADCRIGKGRAIVVADADLLNVDALGPDSRNNLNAVVQELATLANH
ncbi:MAG: hypothetical protein HOP91_08130 [Sphingomonas sp.]|nr:hypothetical protein [Sphingomonas sp.]